MAKTGNDPIVQKKHLTVHCISTQIQVAEAWLHQGLGFFFRVPNLGLGFRV